ncbi:diphosphate--fructose-6-phosphate 1-phosphotransferase [Desulfotomaculum sp. 1211_IL3151]|uniref:diphosphate--fructose-6-phosphate 1-phosphotransferase n=1 Tax=Desulfotomaculum sp. 1211_IL3151 TaxID=3084055 RepID=UPI002FDB927E
MTGSQTLVVAQTGGPSAVINSTLAGIIEEARSWPEIKDVIGCVHGYHGLFGQNYISLSGFDDDLLKRLRNTPGAFLGSSRLPLTDNHFAQIPALLDDLKAGYYLQIGGNGTMYAANLIAEEIKQAGKDMQVIGVPKTVDNDIILMDHTPGFASAARYVIQATLDNGIDLWSMRHFEQVRILEVMGRNVGWLAAASGFAQRNEKEAPHLIYLPEIPFHEDEFIKDVQAVVQELGYAVVVVGEGIRDEQGNSIGNNPFTDVNKGSQVFGGAASYLAAKVTQELKIRARAQDLGMVQRCFTPVRSELDEQEAYWVGRAAVRAAVAGQGGNMVYVEKLAARELLPYQTLPLARIGGKEKEVPEKFYNKQAKHVTAEFKAWLKPLLGQWHLQYLHLHDFPKPQDIHGQGVKAEG